MSTLPSPESPAPSPLRLPPSERDFEIYDAIHIAGSSTRCQADKWEISQTRVRQIIRRVVEWLGEVLPPQPKIAKEQETHLARQIAADRFQRQFEQINELWKATLEPKFASIRIRLTTAQARLGAVGGLIDGLAADAIEGLPVPTWANTESQEGEPREGEASAEPMGPTFPTVTDFESPSVPTQSEICNLKSEIPPPPPPEECSPSNDASPNADPADVARLATTLDSPSTCEPTAASPSASIDSAKPVAQPLLTPGTQAPAIEIRISPDQPGAATIPHHPANANLIDSPPNSQNIHSSA